MLKFLVRITYRNKVYSDDFELFCKHYKWVCGLPIILQLRGIICVSILYIIGIAQISFIRPRFYGLVPICFALLLAKLQVEETKKQIKFNSIKVRTPAQIRSLYIEEFIRKFISIHGKALGPKEWQVIKQYDIGLYNDLLCSECNHCCYYYSLEIARLIKDSTLIWGAINEPFNEKDNYYAHAFILRNGYVYDTNFRQSSEYNDFIKLYKFKLYKMWSYEECSRTSNIDFRALERAEFRQWCQENNVLVYERF